MPRGHEAGVVIQYAMLAGPLLSMLDSSVVNVAAEPIARSLHASLGTVQWTVSGYLLALGTGLAGTASLARRFGTLAVYRASLVAFTAASVLCAVAPGIGALIGCRAVQGLVAAPLVPLAMSMLLGKSGQARTVSAVAGILLFAAPAFGPTVGGVLIGAAGWRLIFAINVPFGVAASWAARRLPEGASRNRSGKSEFDPFGLALLTAGLLFLLLGANEGGTDGWGSAACLGPLVAGAALLAAYVPWASRRARPALDLSLARRPVAALSMGLCALASAVTWAAVFLLPVFVQSVQGRSALAAGVAMAPQGLVTGLSTALGARVLAGRSASIGLIISPLLAALTGPLPPERIPDASTLFNVVNRVAGSFGIGLLVSLYAVLARSAGGPVYALHVSGIVIACVAGLGAVAALALPTGRWPVKSE